MISMQLWLLIEYEYLNSQSWIKKGAYRVLTRPAKLLTTGRFWRGTIFVLLFAKLWILWLQRITLKPWPIYKDLAKINRPRMSWIWERYLQERWRDGIEGIEPGHGGNESKENKLNTYQKFPKNQNKEKI